MNRHAVDDGRLSPEMIQSAIERVVDGTEPRIRLVPGYRKKLRPSVITALDYIDRLVNHIPSAIRVSSKTFAIDPCVNAFFACVEDLQTVFSRCEELRVFFNSHHDNTGREAYALLCMREMEKTVMGMDLRDEMMRRDIMQTAVSFYDHSVLSPADTEAEIRGNLKCCIFDGLITHALRQIASRKLYLHELEDQRRILFNRLRNRMAKADGLTRLLSSLPDSTDNVEDISLQLAATERKLGDLPAYHNAPKAYLDEVINTLIQPDKFIRLKQFDMNLTRMCIKAEKDTSEPVNTIHLNEIEIAEVLTREIAIVRYPREEMLVPA